MKGNIKKGLLVLASASVLSLPALLMRPRTAGASTTHTTSTQTISIDDVMADICTGEDVHITGDLIVTTTITVTQQGDTRIHLHTYAPDINGVGLTSGATYHGEDQTHTMDFESAEGYPASLMDVEKFDLAGQGNIPDLHASENTTLRFDADANVTIYRDTLTSDCN